MNFCHAVAPLLAIVSEFAGQLHSWLHIATARAASELSDIVVAFSSHI